MSDAPRRIWLDNVEDDVTEYVRADIHDAVVAENNVLRDEVGRLQTEAMGAVEGGLQGAGQGDAESNLFAAMARVKALEAALDAIAAEIVVPVPTWKNGINFKKLYEAWRREATKRVDIARARNLL